MMEKNEKDEFISKRSRASTIISIVEAWDYKPNELFKALPHIFVELVDKLKLDFGSEVLDFGVEAEDYYKQLEKVVKKNEN
jgi:hypothetical protein